MGHSRWAIWWAIFGGPIGGSPSKLVGGPSVVGHLVGHSWWAIWWAISGGPICGVSSKPVGQMRWAIWCAIVGGPFGGPIGGPFYRSVVGHLACGVLETGSLSGGPLRGHYSVGRLKTETMEAKVYQTLW